AHKPPRLSSDDPKVPLVSSTFAQEDVSGEIRTVGKVASMVARTLQDPAVGVEPLHSADICERPAAAVVHDVELEPGNVICCRAGRIADRLASHGAAVHVLPGVLSLSISVAIGSRKTQVSLPSLPALHW